MEPAEGGGGDTQDTLVLLCWGNTICAGDPTEMEAASAPKEERRGEKEMEERHGGRRRISFVDIALGESGQPWYMIHLLWGRRLWQSATESSEKMRRDEGELEGHPREGLFARVTTKGCSPRFELENP